MFLCNSKRHYATRTSKFFIFLFQWTRHFCDDTSAWYCHKLRQSHFWFYLCLIQAGILNLTSNTNKLIQIREVSTFVR